MSLIRRSVAAVAVTFVTLFVVGTPALALAPPPVQLDADTVSTVVIAAPIVTIIIALLIPLINGFLTKASTPTSVKAIGTIVLNAAWALIANGVLANGSSAFSTTTLYTAILGAIISITTYAGVYKPINVTSNAGGKLADVGLHD
jgi:uncharacterized membrane protein YeaQ/YmgE (transglycosylase-associated protein family)